MAAGGIILGVNKAGEPVRVLTDGAGRLDVVGSDRTQALLERMCRELTAIRRGVELLCDEELLDEEDE